MFCRSLIVAEVHHIIQNRKFKMLKNNILRRGTPNGVILWAVC